MFFCSVQKGALDQCIFSEQMNICCYLSVLHPVIAIHLEDYELEQLMMLWPEHPDV